MTRIMMIGLMLLPLTTAAWASNPPASDEEKDLATNLMISCLVQRSAELDDGISDVNSIGMAVMANCDHEIRTLAETKARGMKNSPRMFERIYEYMREDNTSAIQAILMHRKDERLPKQ